MSLLLITLVLFTPFAKSAILAQKARISSHPTTLGSITQLSVFPASAKETLSIGSSSFYSSKTPSIQPGQLLPSVGVSTLEILTEQPEDGKPVLVSVVIQNNDTIPYQNVQLVLTL